MLWMLILSVLADNLHWEDPDSGAAFDWSSLKRKVPYVVNDTNSYYLFSLGANLPDNCSEEYVSALQVFSDPNGMYDLCEIVGRHTSRYVSLLDKHHPNYGVRVTYSDGAICEYSDKVDLRQVTFKIRCDTTAQAKFELSGFNSFRKSCHVFFDIKSPAGCPVDYDIASKWRWIGVGLGVAGLAGAAWCFIKKQKDAYEAI